MQTLPRNIVICAIRRVLAYCAFFGALHAQQQIVSIQKLLPAGSALIETANVTGPDGASRVMALWMEHPNKRDGGPEYCGTAIDGVKFYEGPTRLSLVDPAIQRLINTISVSGDGTDTKGTDEFRIPMLISNDFYYVAHSDTKGKGVPTIMYLQDFTGEGIRAQFALFAYAACGITDTSILGYESRSDRVVQYPIWLNGVHEMWAEQIFTAKPIGPGRWSLIWRPGHGVEDIVHDEVSFDRTRRVFIDKQSVSQPESGRK